MTALDRALTLLEVSKPTPGNYVFEVPDKSGNWFTVNYASNQTITAKDPSAKNPWTVTISPGKSSGNSLPDPNNPQWPTSPQ